MVAMSVLYSYINGSMRLEERLGHSRGARLEHGESYRASLRLNKRVPLHRQLAVGTGQRLLCRFFNVSTV